MSVLSESLREELTRRGWSQKRLADAVGVRQQSVGRWVNGEVVPTRANIVAIATAFEEPRAVWLDRWYEADPEEEPKTDTPDVSELSDEELVTELAAVRSALGELTRRVEELAERLEDPPA